MRDRGARRLLGDVHRLGAVAVAAFERVVGLEARPFVQRQFEPVIDGIFRACRWCRTDVPQTSFEACILRAILSVQSCGTWQSGQLARTPERLVKWIVDFSSANTLSRISWQPVQNFSVLVTSSAVLKPPQKITPATKPASTSTPRLNTELGRRSTSHSSTREAQTAPARTRRGVPFGRAHRRPPGCARLSSVSMSTKSLSTGGFTSCCGTWHCGAEEAARRDRGEELAVAIHEMRDRDHRRLRLAGARARMAGQAFVAVDVDLIAVDRVRDQRRLLGIVARPPSRWCCAAASSRGAGPSSSSGVGPRRPGADGLRDQRGSTPRRRAAAASARMPSVSDHGVYTRSIRTAHFLKSVCSEIGSVASSVTLLMSWPRRTTARTRARAAACCGRASRPACG